MRSLVKIKQFTSFIWDRSDSSSNGGIRNYRNADMKAFILTVTTLCLATLAQGYVDYELNCDRDEVGVRWPSYHSNSDYYICNRIGGKQIKLSCNAGELFTFVLQGCTPPGKFIPPPPMRLLPTHSQFNTLPQLGSQQAAASDVALPRPMYPGPNQSPIFLNPQSPPVNGMQHLTPPNIESAAFEPPHVDHIDKYIDSSDSAEKPAVVAKPPPNKKPQPNANNVPMPPTPEPTPPVVKKQPAKKQPQPSDSNKAVKKQLGPPRKNVVASPPQKVAAKPPKKSTNAV